MSDASDIDKEIVLFTPGAPYLREYCFVKSLVTGPA